MKKPLGKITFNLFIELIKYIFIIIQNIFLCCESDTVTSSRPCIQRAVEEPCVVFIQTVILLTLQVNLSKIQDSSTIKKYLLFIFIIPHMNRQSRISNCFLLVIIFGRVCIRDKPIYRPKIGIVDKSLFSHYIARQFRNRL